jgi:acetyltransferase-like isoleucine patch superfamily enzyme
MNVGRGTVIYEPVTILDDEKHIVRIGDNCRIGQYTFIGARKFTMKDGAEICPCAVIAGGGDVTLNEFSTVNFHCTLIPSTFRPEGEYMNDVVPEKSISVRGSIEIGKGAYIGSNVVICVSKKNPHIHIGDRAVIGALSYIDHDVEANTIVHPKIIYDVKKRRSSKE